MKKITKIVFSVLAVAVISNSLGNAIEIKQVQACANSPKVSVEADLFVGKVIHGFRIQAKKYVANIDSTVYQFEHEKTGAKLLFLNNNDDNKVFRIAFKTLPKDNTGVYHIIEHCVLNGEKVKGINPNTSYDFTQYGTDGTIGENFQNKIDNYLDSIFYTPVYNNEMVFMQEGWRYKIDSLEDDLKLNGVVYNEMKKPYSSIKKLTDIINKSLFPDTIYRFNSGGESQYIPKLTYDELLKTHKRYYTPSNSFSFLCGNLDIEKTLQVINDKYFSKFDKVDLNNKIIEQESFTKMKYVEDYYPVKIRDDMKNKTYLALNYATGKEIDLETKHGFIMLESLIVPPLTKALIDNKVGDLYTLTDRNYQESFSFLIMNSNETEKEKFQSIVNEILSDIVEKGFDKEKINSAINLWELNTRIDNFSIDRYENCLEQARNAWLYNGDLIKCFETNYIIENIKEKSKSGYFEKLIEKYFLNNNHSSLVVLKPKLTVEKEDLKEQLDQYKASLSEKELNEIINKNKEFKKWQETCSKQKVGEESRCLEDINRKAKEIPTEVKEIKGTKVLSHSMNTDEIQYVNLYFDTSKVPQNKLMYLMLLTKVLKKVDTEKYNYAKLSNAINTYTGGISFDTIAIENSKDLNEYYPKLKVSMACLDNNLQNVFEVLTEIINKSKFEDKNYLKELISSIKLNVEYEMEDNIYDYVSSQALAYDSDIGKYNNLDKIPFYNFICELDNNFDEKSEEIIRGLDEVRNMAFDKENLVVSCTGDESNYSNFEKCFKGFVKNFKNNNIPVQKYKFDYSKKQYGFTIPSEVQYIAKAGNFRKLGYKDSGKLAVMRMVLWSYLNDEIRRKGGAYGGNVSIYNSSIILYADSDPNLKRTINVFNDAGNFLRNFTADKKRMNKDIIRALEFMDFPSDIKDKGLIADAMYIRGRTQEDIQKYRDEIFSTTAEDIRNYADMMDYIVKQNNLCVMGNESRLKAEKDLFDRIERLYN